MLVDDILCISVCLVKHTVENAVDFQTCFSVKKISFKIRSAGLPLPAVPAASCCWLQDLPPSAANHLGLRNDIRSTSLVTACDLCSPALNHQNIGD